MRVTIKALGDHSRTIAQLKPGTRVLIEGPYGAFTHHVQSTGRVALIAAGVGITPLRAMLEDLPAYVDVAVIVRASAPEDLVHRDEVATLVERRGGQAYAVVGPRRTARLDARSLGRLVPDLAQRDVYVCGPTGFSESILSAALALGVPRDRIHHEAFAF
jgi:ferredoxin-NADP reductase